MNPTKAEIEEEKDTTAWVSAPVVVEPLVEPFKKRSRRKKRRGEKKNSTGFCGFGKVTKENLKKPKGWKNLFEWILYIIPCLIKKVGVRMSVLSKGSATETLHDQKWFVNSCFEFCYIFIAYLFANALFFYVYIEKLRSLHYGINRYLYYFIKLLLFLPDVIYVGIHDVIPFSFKKFGLHLSYTKEDEHEDPSKISSAVRLANVATEYASKIPGVKTASNIANAADAGVGYVVNSTKSLANVAADYASKLPGLQTASNSNTADKGGGLMNVVADYASKLPDLQTASNIADAGGDLMNGTKSLANATLSRLADATGVSKSISNSVKQKSSSTVSSPENVHYCCSFLILFMICYILVYFLLDKLGKMFLQVFDYKADKTVIIFIIGSWVYYMFNSFMDYLKMGFIGPIFFMIGQFIYLCVSIMLAPIAQMIFVVYFFYVFSGNIYSFDSIFGTQFSGLEKSSFELAKDRIQAVKPADDTCLGTMNSVAQTYIYKYFLHVIMMLFFFYKSMESFITLKVSNFKWYFGVLNFLVFCGLSYLYSYFRDPEQKSQSGGGETSISITSILTGLGFVGLVFVIPMSVILAKYK